MQDRDLTPYRGFLLLAVITSGLLGLWARSWALLGMSAAWALFLVQGTVLSRRGVRGVKVRRQIVGSAFEEDVITVGLSLENHSQRDAHMVLITDAFDAAGVEGQALLEPGPLPAQRRRWLQYHFFGPRQWGVYTVGPLTVGAWDPMGLSHHRRRFEQLDPLVVYPRVHDVEGLARLGGQASLVPEDLGAPRAGHSTLCLGIRDYHPGDDVRSIHWPATARRGSPMTREREVDLVPCFTLFLDLQQSGRAGMGRKSTLEYLVRSGASLLWSATRRGYATQVVAEGSRPLLVAFGQGEAHLAHALHELMRARQDGTLPLLDLVERFHRLLPAGSTAALMSASTAIDRGRLAEVLEMLRIVAVHPLVICIDGDSFAPIDRPNAPRVEAEARREELVAFLRSLAVPGTVLHSAQDLEEELVRPDLFQPEP